MSRAIAVKLLALFMLTACSDAQINEQTVKPEVIALQGQWLADVEGESLFDPQTSGLALHRNEVYTIADASALPQHQRKLLPLKLLGEEQGGEALPLVLSRKVQRSCFAQYLKDEPDYEALATDPNDDDVLYVVTEDASRSGTLSKRCERRYQNSGSTDYPTLLLRLERDKPSRLLVTHVRPLRYAPEMQVGNFPNDGIEGITFGKDRTLYLALEKDINGQPRIFGLEIDESFWQSDEFADVSEPALDVPQFDGGNHPINGMGFYPGNDDHPGYLLAAARNDDQLWIIDLAGVMPTRKLDLSFSVSADPSGAQCPEWEKLDNTSLEGVLVVGEQVLLVNDPWKRNYHKNIQCPLNQQYFENYVPILFSLDVDQAWFSPPDPSL